MKKIQGLVQEIMYRQRGYISTVEAVKNSMVFLMIGQHSTRYNGILDRIVNSFSVKVELIRTIDELISIEPILEPIAVDIDDINISEPILSNIFVTLKSVCLTFDEYKLAANYLLEVMQELDNKSSVVGDTPRCLNKLLVEVVEPKQGVFQDITSGLGGDIIEAYNYAKSFGNELTILGQELYRDVYVISTLRLYIEGIRSFDLRQGNSLTNPMFITEDGNLEKVDYSIASLPFGVSWKDCELEIKEDKLGRFIYGYPSVSSAEWLFISTILKSLNSKGKAAVITTMGTLFRAGAEEVLRNKVIGFDYIEAVISLPGLLFSNTAIPSAMIVFNMNKSEEMKGKIQFINAEDIYQRVRRGKNTITDEQVDYIVNIFREKKEVKDTSIILDTNALDNGNLSPSRYVAKKEIETENLGKVKINLDKANYEKKLDDIANFYRGINVTSKNVQDDNGNFKIINLADIQHGMVDIEALPTYSIENNARVESYKVQGGDIIISNRGAIKICVIPEHEGNVLISQNFIGLRLKSGYNPEYIKAYLESPIGQYLLESKKTGTVVTTINVKDIKEIPVKALDIDKQTTIITEYKKQQAMVNEKIEELQRELDQISLNLYREMNINDTFEVM